MNNPILAVIAIILMIPFTALIVALNIRRTNKRHLRLLKKKADRKAKNNIK